MTQGHPAAEKPYLQWKTEVTFYTPFPTLCGVMIISSKVKEHCGCVVKCVYVICVQRVNGRTCVVLAVLCTVGGIQFVCHLCVCCVPMWQFYCIECLCRMCKEVCLQSECRVLCCEYIV